MRARERLRRENPTALLADGLDEALIGVAYRFGALPVALYDRTRAVQLIAEREGISLEEASTRFEETVADNWIGPGTPSYCILDGA